MTEQNACSKLCAFITTLVIVLFIVPNIWFYKKCAAITNLICRTIVAVTVLMIFVPIVMYLSFWLITYRMFISCIVRIYHGRKFNHMLNGRDRICTVEVTSPHVVLFLIKYNQPFDFYAKMSQTIGKTLKEKYNDDKIFSTISSFLGYSYLVKREISVKEYVKPLPSISGKALYKKSLLNAIEEHTQGPLPNNNNGLWEIFIGTQEIAWKNHPDEIGDSFYPIVLRFHPCVSSIVHIMNDILTVPYVKSINGPKSKGKCTIFVNLQNCIRRIWYFFMAPSVFFVNTLTMKCKKNTLNPLYGPKLSHHKTFCVLDEAKRNNIELINEIIEKFPGTTFQDILLSAFTASLDDYYTKILGAVPSSKPHFILTENHFSTGPIEKTKVDSVGKSSTIIMKLPINSSSKVGELEIINLLNTVAKERSRKQRKSIKRKVHQEMVNTIFTYLPTPLLKFVLHTYKCTAIINNLPGPTEVRAIGGEKISNMYIWTPHHGKTGISLTIGTYDERLQLTLSIDDALFTDKEEVHKILEGMYKYLNKMVKI